MHCLLGVAEVVLCTRLSHMASKPQGTSEVHSQKSTNVSVTLKAYTSKQLGGKAKFNFSALSLLSSHALGDSKEILLLSGF